jgi:hypothetical protein
MGNRLFAASQNGGVLGKLGVGAVNTVRGPKTVRSEWFAEPMQFQIFECGCGIRECLAGNDRAYCRVVLDRSTTSRARPKPKVTDQSRSGQVHSFHSPAGAHNLGVDLARSASG